MRNPPTILTTFDFSLLCYFRYYNTYSRSWPVVKAALLSGLYPNVVRVDYRKRHAKFYTKQDGDLKLHPGSVNELGRGRLFHRWLMYYEKTKTQVGLFVYDSTEVRDDHYG